MLLVAIGFGDGSTVYASGGIDVNYSGIKTNEDRIAFIQRFGLTVVTEPREEKSFTMPQNFDRVILGYNELQKKQGLDISKYSKKKVTRYTYEVTNWANDGECVNVNLLVWRSKIIACDVSSGEVGGFVYPLCDVDPAMLKKK